MFVLYFHHDGVASPHLKISHHSQQQLDCLTEGEFGPKSG